MQVNELKSGEVFILGFGGSITLTAIILCSMYFGHFITTRSIPPTPITVTAAAPNINIHVPEQPAPKVEVTAAAPKVDVHVPVGPAPTVNVTSSPAQITVLDKREIEKGEKQDLQIVPANPLPPDAPKAIPVSASVKSDKTSSVIVPEPTSSQPEEEASLDSLYRNAEGYIASYCIKKGIDPDAASKSWLGAWQKRVDQAISDNTDTSEQTFINRIVVEKRNSFLMDRATPDQIVEACRILLRYRDGRLAMLNAMNEALTKENLKKTVVFLAAGPK